MKKALGIIGWVLWVAVLVIIGLPTLEGAVEGGEIFLGLYVVLSAMFYFPYRAMKKRKALKAVEKIERERKIEAELIPAHVHTARHEAGLPVPAGVPCEVRVFSKHLEFSVAAQRYTVPMDRVTGAQEFNETEMRQYIKSSAFQTVLGGLAFGGVGAVVGAMPESKYRREVSKHNLLVSFLAENGTPSSVVLSSDTSLFVLGNAVRHYCRGAANNTVSL